MKTNGQNQTSVSEDAGQDIDYTSSKWINNFIVGNLHEAGQAICGIANTLLLGVILNIFLWYFVPKILPYQEEVYLVTMHTYLIFAGNILVFLVIVNKIYTAGNILVNVKKHFKTDVSTSKTDVSTSKTDVSTSSRNKDPYFNR